MQTTIDKAGRLVIPKVLRDRLGLAPGPVQLEADGAGLRISPIADDAFEHSHGLLIIPASGAPIDDDQVQKLREADQE